ncbi:MAG TPA: SDR family oxidoreductase, partial [Acidimicrobiales bacterium]|nr:SDR family oxidoreductase [Acidimicrobiales bacterium]
MDLGIDGKVAVVAASSRGLGRACAVSLAREGAKVVLSGRDEASLGETAALIASDGGQVTSLVCDVTLPESPAELIAHACSVFGTVDIVIANAGGPPQGKALDVTDEALFEAVNGNFAASVRLITQALPYMTKNGWGRAVCITSSSIFQAIASIPMSNSARIALWAWVKVAAREVAGSGITLNLACPGTHGTERMAKLVSVGSPGDFPMGDPAKFGEVVAFLCSDQASYVNGAALVIDGGASLA